MVLFLMALVLPAPAGALEDPFRVESWSLEEAVKILNESPWARQETYTRIVGGIGSGIQGEKEIFSTFFVRFLSAEPIQKAYARVKQIHLGYDELADEEKQRLDREIENALNIEVDDWIVVAVAFRSNNPSQESRVDQFFESQTSETIKTRAYLSTQRFPRIQIAAYYPPDEKSVGAKFVFPRRIDGTPVVSPSDDDLAFELDVPGIQSDLRASFSVKEMMIEDDLIL
jgi:hypothetical protein